MHIITSHRSTDFDGLASVIAATLLYPDATPVLPRALNPNVRGFLSIHKDQYEMIAPNDINLDAVERLIVVDTNNWDRLENMERLKTKEGLDVVVWDHHPPGDIAVGEIHRKMTGANITQMMEELRRRGKALRPVQATLFLAGLYEDTGNLTFASTTADDAHAAGFLLENDADLGIIATFLRPVYGEKQKNILFEMLKTATRTRINGYNVSFNKLEINSHVGGLAVVVDMYREILNVDAAFGIFSDRRRGKCMIIGRSFVDEFNVGAVMRSMGGGGHPGAGSAMIASVNPDAVEEWISELIRGNQRSSVQISDLMSFPVVSVRSDATMEDVSAVLSERGCKGLPVIDDGVLKGVVSRRDFKKIRKNAQRRSPVKAFMSTDVVFVNPGISPMEAARLMVKHDIGRLPVVKNGKVIGIVSRSDAMAYFYDLLPE